jgi:Domain of unknown function (DUF4267)
MLAVLGIIAVGLRFLLSPEQAAAAFAVPAGQAGNGAYLTAKGIRDNASGIFAGHLPCRDRCDGYRTVRRRRTGGEPWASMRSWTARSCWPLARRNSAARSATSV